MNECNWKSFEDFGNCAFGYWKITINKDNWKLSTCTCPIYFKQYICKHIIGFSILLKIVGKQMPNNARDDVIGSQRGRGRPRRQFRSLQDADLSEFDEDDDIEIAVDPPAIIDAPLLVLEKHFCL